MKIIYKYSIPWYSGPILLPTGAKPLMVALQNGVPMLWVECAHDASMKKYQTFIVATGGIVPDADHVGSFIDGAFVWHVYIDKELASDRQ